MWFAKPSSRERGRGDGRCSESASDGGGVVLGVVIDHEELIARADLIHQRLQQVRE